MEIASSFSSGGGGGDDDDNNGNKKPLLKQQKEKPPSKEQRKILTRTILSENARLNTFLNELATRYGFDLGGHVRITPNIAATIVRHFRELYRSLEVSERRETDRVVDTIVEAYRRTRADILNMNLDMLAQQLEERLISEYLTEINRSFTNGNPNDLYWLDLDNEDELSDAQIETAAQDIQNMIREIINIRQIQMFQQLNMMPPPPPPQPPVAPATDNSDEEMDDEES